MYEAILSFLTINNARINNIVKFERSCNFIDLYKKFNVDFLVH